METPIQCSPTQWAQSQDWEAVKLTIARLYKVERKKLREVKAIMETEHNFHATINMYKKRVTKWGLDKNLKGHEAVAMAEASRRRRLEQGKHSEFTVRGELVDENRLGRHLRRKTLQRHRLTDRVGEWWRGRESPGGRGDLEDGEETKRDCQLDQHRLSQLRINARTPSPTPITTTKPQCHSPSPSIAIALSRASSLEDLTETLLQLTDSYISGALSSNIWTINSLSLLQSHTEQPGQLLLGRVFSRFAIARLYALHRPLEPLELYRLLAPAFPSLEQAVQSQTPFLLAFLMVNVSRLFVQAAAGVARIVCDFVTGVAGRLFGEGHGLVRAWKMVEAVSRMDQGDWACEKLTRLFDDRLPDPRKPYLKYQGDRRFLIAKGDMGKWEWKQGGRSMLSVEPDLFYSFPGFSGWIQGHLSVKAAKGDPTKISVEYIPQAVADIDQYPISVPIHEYLYQSAIIGFENALLEDDPAFARRLQALRSQSLQQFLGTQDRHGRGETEYGTTSLH